MLSEANLRRYHVPLAWGLLALVLLLALFLIILPIVQETLALGQQVENGYQQLSRFQKLSTATPELTKEYAQVQQQGLDKLFYPAGMTSAQVAKELQKTLASVVGNGGVLVSSEVVDQQQTDQQADEQAKHSGYQQVTVKAVFQSSMELLRDVLHQAYRARPLIFVDSLDIQPYKEDGADKQTVRAEVKISTYWRNGEAAHEKAD